MTAHYAASEENAPLTVVTVLEPDSLSDNIYFIDYISFLAASCHAAVSVIVNKAAAAALCSYIRTNHITHIFIGTPGAENKFGTSITKLVNALLPGYVRLILLPPLCEQTISAIDFVKASELSLFLRRNSLQLA